MKRQKRVLALAALAGLAASATASGQLEIVNNLPGDFVDITATGTYYNLGDDGSQVISSTAGNSVLPPGTHSVTNNGAISWGSTAGTAFTNQSIPSSALAGGGQALAVYWDDLYTYPAAMTPAEGVYVQTIGGTLYITWRVGHINAPESTGEVQLQVFSSGPILAQYIYRQVDGYGAGQNNGESATVGYQNGSAGFNNVQFSFNTANSIQNGMVLSLVFSGPTGACCMPSGACTISSANACASAGGIYRGNGTTCPANCPQPPTGACCLPNLTCIVTWQGGCTSQGGTYRGDNTPCTQCPQAWQEQGDAGDLPATAQFVTGSGPLPGIVGTNGREDTDLYAIQIIDAANFRATTINTGTTFDTMLWLFDATGHGVVGNDDDGGTLQSLLTSQFIPGNGLYYLGLTRFFRVPVDAANQGLWEFYSPEQRPNGPGAANEVAGWEGLSGDGGPYTIFLGGAGFVNPATIGACCLPSGACSLNTSAGCSGAGGIYRGDGTTCPANCPQPPTGACCLPNLTCVVVWQGGCTAQGGTYQGDNSPCTRCPQAWQEQGDAGDLPGTAQIISGSGNLPGIVGDLGDSDADMYRLQICDAAAFSATTVDPNIFWDTQLFLFDATGHGVTFDDDSQGVLQSTLTSQFIPGNGEYFLAISGYDHDPLGGTTSSEIWMDTPFEVERRPDGPAAGEAVGSWSEFGDFGAYTIRMTGACYIGSACYADCNGDHALNVNDFVCFQSAFAGNNPQADCDHNSQFNVNDFVCFQSAFAAGCSQL